jgi:hypothetical protein
MPSNPAWPDETREMRLFSKVIAAYRPVVDKSLPEFIARRRAPGEGWMTWDEVRYELHKATGEFVTDGSIRRWAKRYGIPEDTSAEPGGSAGYTEALAESGITIS